MLIPKDKLQAIYDHMKQKVQAAEGSVLICVAGETDAMAGSHIFMSMLQADNVAYSMSAVRGIDDIVEKVDEVDQDTCHTVVLLNCGAGEDIIDRLKLMDDPEREHLQVLIIDSHRPFSLANVYADCEDKDGEGLDEGDIEKSRVLLLHDPELDLDTIPDKETMIAAHMDEEDEEDEEEEEDFGESPVQRRRVGEDGESVAVVDGEEDDREERRQRREKRNEARAILHEYNNGTSRGPATAMVLMELSNGRVNKLDPATLWFAILGVTEQFVKDDMDHQLYVKMVEALMDEAISLNAKSATELGGSKIVQVNEFPFYLLDHWNLYNSMYYSPFMSTKLELWKDRTSNKLHTLLAKMGIPLAEAEQKYQHMKTTMKQRLEDKLLEADELTAEFNLENIVFQTFRKERKNGTHISATQCTQICNAILCLPPSADEQWTDAFDRASDAIWKSANREQAWDDLVNQTGANSVVQGAIRLQQAVMHKAFEICQSKDMQKHGGAGFTSSRFVAGRDNQILLHPAALSQLAQTVLSLDRKRYEDRKKHSGKSVANTHSRWVLGVENEEDTTCLIVGVHASSELGYKERNRFGKLFADAVEHGVEGCEVQACLQGFDTNVLQLTSGKFEDFISWLNNALSDTTVSA